MKKLFLILIAISLASACKKENAPLQITNANSRVAGSLSQAADTSADVPNPPTPMQAPPPKLDGTYTGVLEARSIFYNTPDPITRRVSVQVKISGNNFGSGDPNNYSAVGGGLFNFLDSFKGTSGSFTAFGDLYFNNTDTSLRDNTTLNPNAGLFGSYGYQVKGDSLFLSHGFREISYRYKLKKQ